MDLFTQLRFRCAFCKQMHDTAEAALACKHADKPNLIERVLLCPVCHKVAVILPAQATITTATDKDIEKAKRHCAISDGAPKVPRCAECGVKVTQQQAVDSKQFGCSPKCPTCLATLFNRTGPARTNPALTIISW